jgi:hypothetical protein
MNNDIHVLHHLGIISRNLEAAVEQYERLGFLFTPLTLPPPVKRVAFWEGAMSHLQPQISADPPCLWTSAHFFDVPLTYGGASNPMKRAASRYFRRTALALERNRKFLS